MSAEAARTGALDVLAQHIMGCACSEPFDLLKLYDELVTAGPYRDLIWEDFEQVVDFVSTGGYALKTYDRFRRIVKTREGLWKVRDPATAESMGKAGRERAAAEFSWDAIAEQTLGVYQAVTR